MLVNWRVNNSASVNRKQNAFILGIEEQMNACKMPKLFCFLSQIKVDNGPFFFSNFQRKKRNAFAFFPVAFPLLFIFASVVFPQILLVFFLKVIWCKSWVLVGLLRTCAVSRTRIHFFFSCFILVIKCALLTFGYTNMSRRVCLECMFDLLMEIGLSWPGGILVTLVSAKGNSTKDGLQGERHQYKDREQIW